MNEVKCRLTKGALGIALFNPSFTHSVNLYFLIRHKDIKPRCPNIQNKDSQEVKTESIFIGVHVVESTFAFNTTGLTIYKMFQYHYRQGDLVHKQDRRYGRSHGRHVNPCGTSALEIYNSFYSNL
jgi:hypothetical protein